MKRQPLTPELALAAAKDVGNESMRKAGRTTWDRDDWYAASREFNRRWPRHFDVLDCTNPRQKGENVKKITITIRTENAAFHDHDGVPNPGPEIGRILHGLAHRAIEGMEDAPFTLRIYDINGNPVGRIKAK